jgi:IPT/TIG domain
VDALAVIGDAGAYGTTNNASDGVVSLTSGSLNFTRADQRTRVVPYCHVTPGFFTGLGMSCSNNQGIADINDPSHLTAQIVRSFLADTSSWQSIGATPSQDPFLKVYGGTFLALKGTNDLYFRDLMSVQFDNGASQLTGGPSNVIASIFYTEYASGGQHNFVMNHASGQPTTATGTISVGGSRALLFKFGPLISSVQSITPTGLSGLTIASGSTILVSGVGFGNTTATQLSANGALLSISQISDQQITTYLPSSYNGLVQFTVANANRQHSVNAMTVPASPQTSPPFGHLDTPINASINQAGAINFTGWALSRATVAQVALCREPVAGEGNVIDPHCLLSSSPNGLIYLGNAVLVPGVRPDVAATFPGYPNNNWGWGAQILTNYLPGTNGLPLGNGTYKLHAIAADPTGLSTDLGTTTISTNNAASVLPFGTIDTPGQGQTISGASYINFGWVVTPQPNIVPIDGSTIVVHIDGQVVGRPTYSQVRSDIATLFPGLRNTTSPNGAVGFFVIDTTKLSNGIHNIDWVATDSAGHSGGIGSRNFFVSN